VGGPERRGAHQRHSTVLQLDSYSVTFATVAAEPGSKDFGVQGANQSPIVSLVTAVLLLCCGHVCTDRPMGRLQHTALTTLPKGNICVHWCCLAQSFTGLCN
jgi:hypothetical protein